MLDDAPFAAPGMERIRREGDTEDLLNGMIAELHYMMREVALRSACQTTDKLSRQHFLMNAMALAETGAKVGKTIAKLRAADRVVELHQHRVIEQVARTLPAREKS